MADGPQHPDGLDDDAYDDYDDYDDVVRRVRSGVTGIHPRHDALGVVRHQVGRRRKRRRVVTAVASVAAAAVVVPVALVALQAGGDDGAVDPADRATDVAEFDGTSPAAYFVQNAGGRSRAQAILYRKAKGQRYYARFLWFPDVDDRIPVYAAAAVEQYDGDAADACADVVAADAAEGGTSTCTTADDGTVVRTHDTTGRIAIDAVNRRGPFDGPVAGDQVRAVTAFRTDGWAVSLTLCACTAFKDGVDLDAPPLPASELARIATIPLWVPNPEGASATASTPPPS